MRKQSSCCGCSSIRRVHVICFFFKYISFKKGKMLLRLCITWFALVISSFAVSEHSRTKRGKWLGDALRMLSVLREDIKHQGVKVHAQVHACYFQFNLILHESRPVNISRTHSTSTTTSLHSCSTSSTSSTSKK